MIKLADTIVSMIILFFFCHGLGVTFIPYLLGDFGLSIQLSMVVSFLVTVVAHIVQFFINLHRKRKTSNDDIIDDMD
jgi:putative effector of murein hydrolase LrgA (UPF0299 family)